MMRHLNVRLFLMLIAGVAALGAVTHVAHNFQVKRQSGALVREADRAKKDGKTSEEAEYLRKFLLLDPGNAQALERLANLMFADGRARESQVLFSQLMQREPNNEEARRKLVTSALQLRRYQDALYHLDEFLLKSHPDDGDLLFERGLCQQALGQLRSAAESYRVAIDKKPTLLAAYRQLTTLLADRFEEQAGAVSYLNKMVAHNPEQSDAYIVRGSFIQTHAGNALIQKAMLGSDELKAGEPSRAMLLRAQADAKQALKRAPSDPQVLLFAAETAFANNLHEEAKSFAEQSVRKDPTLTASYLVLASLEEQGGRPKKAIEWLQRGLNANPRDPLLLVTEANLEIEANDIAAAQKSIEPLRRMQAIRPLVRYLDARLLAAQSKWAQARVQLEAVAGDLEHWPQFQREARFWLGCCEERLGRNDLRLAAFRAALEVDPLWAPARLGLAEALASLGRLEEAILEYQRLLQLPKVPAGAAVGLWQLVILRNLARPPQDRNWEVVEKGLKETSGDTSRSEILLLTSEILVGKEKLEEARKLLQAAIGQHPTESSLWSGLISLESRRQNWDEVEKSLAAMQKSLGDGVGYRLTTADYLTRRFHAQAKARLEALAIPQAGWSAGDRIALARGMTRFALSIRDFSEAERLCRLVADAEPANLQTRLLMFEIAWQMQRPEAMEKALAEVRIIEQEGPYWLYGDALRLTMLARQRRDNSLLSQALSQLSKAQLRRPNWSSAVLLAGEINDIRGERDAAVENFRRAVELGERDPQIVSKLVGLLSERRDYVAAESIVKKLQEEKTPLSMELRRIASEASIRTGDLDRAVVLARESAAHSKEPRDQIWLGQVLRISGHTQEAITQLKLATQLAPDDASAWVALIQCYLTAGQREEAKKAIAAAKSKIDRAQAPLVLAYAYELSGQTAEAEKQYDAAVREWPNDIRFRRMAAEYKLRAGNLQATEALLTGMLNAPESSIGRENQVWARRTLTLALAAAATYPSYVRGRGMIEKNLELDPRSGADLRAKALLEASFPTHENVQNAVKELESLAKRPGTLSFEDRLILGKLYLLEGDANKGLAVFRDLAVQSKEVRYVDAYVEVLLSRNELTEADVWLSRLDELSPHDFATIDLRARRLAAKQNYGQAYELLSGFFDKVAADPKIALAHRRTASDRLEQFGSDVVKLGRKDEAERFFARAEGLLSGPQGEPSLDRARFLIRRDRTAEALVEFERVAKKAEPDDVGITCLALAAVKSADESLNNRIDRLIVAVAEKRSLLRAWQASAFFRDRLERYDAAEQSYRRALSLDADDMVALNNLAYLLVLRNKNLPESLSLIERAIAKAGPRPALLDSRAMARLANGRRAEALADANLAVRDDPSPLNLFHQARVCLANGQREAAAASLEKARQAGLSAAIFHPLELAALQELAAQLARRPRADHQPEFGTQRSLAQ